MNIVGTWDLTIATPFGSQVVTLDFASEHDGVARFQGGQVDLAGMRVSGDTLSCDVAITAPVRTTLKCSVTVDGETLSGTASAGFFGRFPVTGHRTATPTY